MGKVFTKFLKNPSLKRLEKNILEEFGEEGLKKFKKSDLKLCLDSNIIPTFNYMTGNLGIEFNKFKGKYIDLNNAP